MSATSVRFEYQGFLAKANTYIEEQKLSGFCPSPEQARLSLDTLDAFSLPAIEISAVTNAVVLQASLCIPVRIYDPCPERRKPVIVYLHGGGHMCGSVDLYDPICRRLAARTNQLVVAVDYRLAPEFPYPCGLDDCRLVVNQLASVLAGNCVDLSRVTLAGDSAGGALAATIAWQSSRTNIHRLILIYPSLDYTFSTDSYQRLASGFLLETHKIQWYFNHYFKPTSDRRQASPLFFPSLDKMPRTLILGAELDPLVDEGLQFHQRLLAAGVASNYVGNSGRIHCFLNLETLDARFIDEIYEIISGFTK